MPGSILFPTDYSEAANAALPFAVALARQKNVSLLVLHVAPNDRLAESRNEYSSAQERAGLEEFLTSLSQSTTPQIPHAIRTVSGNAAEQIAKIADEEQVELIVMATAGRTGLGRLVMGSVAQSVMRLAPCPVLTVKQPIVAEASEPALPSHERISAPDSDPGRICRPGDRRSPGFRVEWDGRSLSNRWTLGTYLPFAGRRGPFVGHATEGHGRTGYFQSLSGARGAT